MFLLRLLIRNAFRHKLRTVLTQFGLALAICALGLLRTVVDAWYAGPQAASGTRLITHSAVSMFATLPQHLADQIHGLDGVDQVSWRLWFGGTYRDPKNFFAQFAVDAESDAALYPEYRVEPAQRAAFLQDRSGVLVGAKLARKYGWKLGDAVVLQGTLYPGEWRFNVRGIYRGATADTDEQQMFMHWQRVADSVRARSPADADRVSVFVVGIHKAADAALMARRIDALFANSTHETLTETERAYKLGIVAMSQTILIGINAISGVVILVIMAVMINTMAMTARERLGEYATLKALGFSPGFVVRLLVGEGLVIALIGGALGLALTLPVVRAFGGAVDLFPVFELSVDTAALQLLASACLGLLSALWPAWTVSRIPIVQGLRHAG
jgi:putative ABC transport system permease protein